MPESGTLTKAHIVEVITETNGYTHKQAHETFEILLELIKKSLQSSEDVLISGFGKFSVKQKAKRKGRNPATAGDMILEPRRVVTFKCPGLLRAKLNREKAAAKKRHPKR